MNHQKNNKQSKCTVLPLLCYATSFSQLAFHHCTGRNNWPYLANVLVIDSSRKGVSVSFFTHTLMMLELIKWTNQHMFTWFLLTFSAEDGCSYCRVCVRAEKYIKLLVLWRDEQQKRAKEFPGSERRNHVEYNVWSSVMHLWDKYLYQVLFVVKY